MIQLKHSRAHAATMRVSLGSNRDDEWNSVTSVRCGGKGVEMSRKIHTLDNNAGIQKHTMTPYGRRVHAKMANISYKAQLTQ